MPTQQDARISTQRSQSTSSLGPEHSHSLSSRQQSHGQRNWYISSNGPPLLSPLTVPFNNTCTTMSIFRLKKKSNTASPQPKNTKPKLFVLASKPRSTETEWVLELLVPVDSKPNAGSAPTDQRYFFSRLLPDTHTTTPPPSTDLRIFVCSVALADPEERLTETLKVVHLTPEPSAWLRQALFALQTADIIPGVSHGLDVNNFMLFATSYPSDSTNTNVNYSSIAKENERLRKMFSSPDTDYSVINDSRQDHVDDEEDHWNDHSAATKQDGKGWGGFWVTHGSGNSSSRAPEAYGSRNVYGGLM